MARKQTIRVKQTSGNVFADLGLPNADERRLKAQLVGSIHDVLRSRKLTQSAAAALLGLSQPDVSRLLRGQFRDYSLERLLRLLTALDRDVDIVIRRKLAASRRLGQVHVVESTATGSGPNVMHRFHKV